MKINIKDWVKHRKEDINEELGGVYLSQLPTLLILQMGDDPASNSYIKGKMKDAEECGIPASLFKTNNVGSLKRFVAANAKYYDGIILQEPCGLDEEDKKVILSYILNEQDVDGFLPNSKHQPCTPKGIMKIIDEFYEPDNPYKPNLHGKTVAVIGRGELVGKPLIPMLVERGATTISCNSKTRDLATFTKAADIVITAVGKEKLITRDMLKDGAFVVDAGITFDELGKLCGDCDKVLYDDEDVRVTPVPGGVGLTTRLALMENVVDAAQIMK